MSRSIWLVLALFPLVGLAKDPELSLCILCHGTNANGNQAVRAPKLAGRESWYLRAQLEAFRAGTRGGHALDVSGSEMRTIALTIPGDEVSKVAESIARLPAVAPTATVQGDASRGRELYRLCVACHGERAQGNAALRAPALTGGNDWYWAIQLNNFRNGLRGATAGNVPSMQMRAAAATLPDEQAVNDVVAFISALSASN